VLQTLDIKPQSQALPTQVNCTQCGGARLLIFSDFQLGGQWHYCPDCKSKGDMVHLAARCWSVSIESAIRKLDNLGCEFPTNVSIEESITLYKRHYIDYPDTVNRLWKNARQEMQDNWDKYKGRLQKLSLNSRIQKDWRPAGVCQLVGLTTVSDINRCFHPNSSKLEDKGYVSMGRNRIFKGRGWDDVLIFPFYDLPARLRSFMFVGRDGNTEEDITYTALYFNDQSREAGLFMHPATATSTGTVFAFGNPLVAAKLLFNHLGKKQVPLDIVAWSDEGGSRKTRRAWHMLAGRRIVLCSRIIDADVIVQGALSNGHISTICPDDSTQRLINEWVRQFPVETRLSQIDDATVHWRTALEDYVRENDSEAIVELFRKLEDSGQSSDVVASSCSREAQDKITEALYEGISGKTVTVNSRVIEEREDGWFWRKASGEEELISEAAFRIDKVIRHKDSTVYRGRILYHGEQLDFSVSRNKFDAKPLRWMQDFILDAGLGFMQYSSQWSSKAISIATAFKRPEAVTGLTTIGWDKEEATMVTPKFCIKWTGEVYSCADLIPTDKLPGYILEPPAPVSPDDLEDLLKDTPENVAVWSLFSAIAANIVAPALNREPTGIGYVGSKGLLDYVADTCGCQRAMLTNKSMSDVMALEEEHNWPLYVITGRRIMKAELLRAYVGLSSDDRNCVTRMESYQGDVLGINGDWTIIHGPVGDTPAIDILERKPALLAAYLKQLLTNKLTLDREADTHAAILDDICLWLSSLHLDVSVLNKARETPAFKKNKAGLVADILCSAISEGLVTIKPVEYVEGPNSLWRTDSGIFIPLETLNLITEVKSTPRINVAAVKKHLTKEGVLFGGINIKDQEGLLIDEAWLSKHRRNNQDRYMM